MLNLLAPLLTFDNLSDPVAQDISKKSSNSNSIAASKSVFFSKVQLKNAPKERRSSDELWREKIYNFVVDLMNTKRKGRQDPLSDQQLALLLTILHFQMQYNLSSDELWISLISFSHEISGAKRRLIVRFFLESPFAKASIPNHFCQNVIQVWIFELLGYITAGKMDDEYSIVSNNTSTSFIYMKMT